MVNNTHSKQSHPKGHQTAEEVAELKNVPPKYAESHLNRSVAGVVESGEEHNEGEHHRFRVVETDDGDVDGEEEEKITQSEKKDGHQHVGATVHARIVRTVPS